jgi:hypothetical protein
MQHLHTMFWSHSSAEDADGLKALALIVLQQQGCGSKHSRVVLTQHVRFPPIFLHRPGKDLPGIQDAVLRTAERILGDENLEDGSIKLPHKCTLRLLLYKPQIGLVMGKRGSTINEMRNKSSATIKLLSPEQDGVPIVPCALPDDEMVMVGSGYASNCMLVQAESVTG